MNVDRAIRRAERIPRLEDLARRHSLFSENLIEITPRRFVLPGGLDGLGLALGLHAAFHRRWSIRVAGVYNGPGAQRGLSPIRVYRAGP